MVYIYSRNKKKIEATIPLKIRICMLLERVISFSVPSLYVNKKLARLNIMRVFFFLICKMKVFIVFDLYGPM